MQRTWDIIDFVIKRPSYDPADITCNYAADFTSHIAGKRTIVIVNWLLPFFS
jgi:hypothetical protein